ncbi:MULTISPECIES: sugar ABC transporter ATP-binding protein [Mesorhizobium]|uniref:Sugar ABC transporter ATP-binding protein n=11 Tax=Mesorhizobium TaxID=68287 RepID=A0ABU5AS52_9HYPH|nr:MULTISPECIES: sugar ABC transporter ATP-binding protein [Mesorhizobium]MDX8432125.1 sugar ABC transporter ATP-binding protein [Mesorhizobium abyssinicae]MDX8540071.1 sugar ABC transporter ATP-binding protein [Mesorhizobium abyssinicae]RUW22023.1 sugar ABC transporter ATP-binding protein [Mesorhizobium sp. M4B.F.Ca.ET.013.02.1.1]RVD15633.1 sugar ABC transporter ATP-binding protein [Mesorhizobium sp. M4B.F.Ca.ET.017.02.2.1]RWA61409.1 MAG: sugar ABC transporter ATP-binding protein [Mesorhizobi
MNYSDVSIAQSAIAPFLSLDGVRKTYPGVVALDGFSMEVRPGEVIGLVGENGAGKSTLMKILGGVTRPDTGTITVDGVAHDGLTVEASIGSGIAFVHQELNLFENLDVAANIFFGREPLKAGPLKLVDRSKLREMVAPLLKRVGANFSADAPVASLSLAQQQMVEIAKALSIKARLVILDEPTSSLPIAETEKLLDVIKALKAEAISVIFISHRLHEVERVADRVVVLRDGMLAGTLPKNQINHDQMVKLMIGRMLKERERVSDSAHAPGGTALSARAVRTSAYPERPVDLDVRHGEILGFAGLVGSGRTELARVLFGIDERFGGSVTLDGKTLKLGSAADAVASGIFLVPEDRKLTGILLDLSIAENISLPNLPAHAKHQLVSTSAEIATAEKQKSNLGIKAPSVATRTGTLSGGNQQKVVLAKWLAMNPKVMILDEPTRGIDIGAKAEIYGLMRALADAGVAVLMISSDMEEVIGVSDRIAVMHEGQISGILEKDDFSQENVLRLAVGKKPLPAQAVGGAQ